MALTTLLSALGIDLSNASKDYKDYAINKEAVKLGQKALNTMLFWSKSQTITRPTNTTAYANTGEVVCGPTYSVVGNTTNGSPTISGISASDIAKCYVGQTISGTGIPANSSVIAVGATSITINNNASADGTGITLTLSSEFFIINLANNLLPGGQAAVAGQYFRLTEAFVSCSNGAATTKLNATVLLFSAPPYPTTYTDNSALALSQAELMSKLCGAAEAVNSAFPCGGTYVSRQINLNTICHLASNSTKVYAIVLTTNAMSPASAETIILNIKGQLL